MDLIVQGHPKTGRPFFCVPGIREYHDHPQHSGDPWLLHRHTGEGSLATIADRIWRAMSRNLLGLHVEFQTLPGRLNVQLRLQSAPGDVAPNLWEQARQGANTGLALPPAVLPPEIRAALGITEPSEEGGHEGER